MADNATDTPRSPRAVPVCAIGASAGGVGVLQTLFRLLPDDLGLAYVVVVHLAPDHPSAMHEIIGACTRMPVYQVQDGPTLKADCVYVIAPDRELVIEGDDVKSRPFTDPRGRRAPIDMFFRSIAAARGDGIAVVLTGSGSDGAVGVRAIKEAGGIVMVQEPAEAGFPSMPQNAIATGVADVVAPVARLAERIAEAARSKEAVRSLDEDGAANDLRRIVAFLRTRTGHDFSGYKRSTVLRRVMRRMQVCQITSLQDYAIHLRGTPEEGKALFADLLISVTMFFRDPDAFEALARRVVTPLLERAGEGEEEGGLRAWVVGCATGEEAYSLAILIVEEAERLKVHVPAQIFATDLDEGALATAREGRYPRSIEADVSPERLKRYFVDEGTHYRIHRRIRDLVLFATHSVVREPPFMRLDLVTCRNVLIYLERTLQQHVCTIFHYGLKPGGALFLGPAETADMVPDQFVAIDREARIYRSRGAGVPVPVLASSAPMSLGRPFPTAEGRIAVPRFEAGEVLGASHAVALEASAPPSALVDLDHAVLHLSPTAGRFILLSAGPLSGKLPSIVHPELRLDLKLALDRVFDTHQPTVTRPVDLRLDGEMRRVSAQIVPVPTIEGAGARATVFFLDGGPSVALDVPERPPAFDELRQLHGELKAAQEAALAGRVGHEAALQELRASNEELQSLNEEYRSTAEELETSKEELQSINEELQTVNAELKIKLSAISAAHDDLQNLTASSEIGTLFLDTALRIRMFTPRVAELINITEVDVGRPVTDFTHRLDYDDIEADVRLVLRDLAPIEREVRGFGDRWFTLRVRPYRTADDRIEGAVVTFDEVTARRRGEVALRDSEALLRVALASGRMGTWRWDLDRRLVWGDATFLALWGFPPSDEAHPLALFTERMSRDGASEMEAIVTKAIAAGEEFDGSLEIISGPTAGSWIRWRGRADVHATSTLYGVTFDITDQRRAEAALRASEERQAFLLNLTDALRPLTDAGDIERRATSLLGEHLQADRCFLSPVSEDGSGMCVREEYLRSGASSVLGDYTFAQFGDFVGPELHAGRILAVEDVSALTDIDVAERASYAATETQAYLLVPLVRDGRLAAFLTVNHRTARTWSEADRAVARQTADRLWTARERARAETALRESEERLRTLMEGVPQLIWRAEPHGAWTWSSPQWSAYTGLSEVDSRGKGWLAALHPDDRADAEAAWANGSSGEALTMETRIYNAREDRYRWFATRATPLHDGSGRLVEWLGTSTDIHDLRELQERKVLVAELQHRTRNLMGVVRSTAEATLRASTDLADFAPRYRDRLGALARVQGLLSRLDGHERIMFDDLIRSELDAMGADESGGRVLLEGPAGIALRSSTVQTFALALHELATNALKYGALKQPAGRLVVTWRLEPAGPDGRPWLHVDWHESGVTMPAADAATQGSGQGRQLIERALPYQLGAITTYVMESGGVRCSIAVPVSHRTTEGDRT